MSLYPDFDLADARRDYWEAVDARTIPYDGPERRTTKKAPTSQSGDGGHLVSDNHKEHT